MDLYELNAGIRKMYDRICGRDEYKYMGLVVDRGLGEELSWWEDVEERPRVYGDEVELYMKKRWDREFNY